MYYTILNLFLIALPALSFGQDSGFDMDKLKFHGRGLHIPKDTIINMFGEADIAYPEYECGGFSSDWQGCTFYQLKYQYFNYIGCDSALFTLEKVTMDHQGEVKLYYDGMPLTGQTTKADFINIFGKGTVSRFRQDENGESVLLLAKGYDNGFRFVFRDGKLSSCEYWTSC
ncbi:MAG: hypothetical protein KDD36_12960 [Flavobacteriales bacterium]|nr:hypothetical protein [Flavobacteriales bacterium]